MGFGLPAAIGAALANPGRRVLCISGDGSFQMNIQELATLAELGLPVTILLMNNGHLGLVRQQQELFYDGNYMASRFELELDFAAIGRQFGIRGYRVRQPASITDILREALSHNGPSLVDIPVHHEENVFPMVPPRREHGHDRDQRATRVARPREEVCIDQGGRAPPERSSLCRWRGRRVPVCGCPVMPTVPFCPVP